MTVPSPLDDVRAQYEALPYPPRDPREEAHPADHRHAEPHPRGQPLPLLRPARISCGRSAPWSRAAARAMPASCWPSSWSTGAARARSSISTCRPPRAQICEAPRQGARPAQHPVPDRLAARPAVDADRPVRLHRLHRRAASPARSGRRHARAGQRPAARRRHGRDALRRVWPQRRLSPAGAAAHPGAALDGARRPASPWPSG